MIDKFLHQLEYERMLRIKGDEFFFEDNFLDKYNTKYLELKFNNEEIEYEYINEDNIEVQKGGEDITINNENINKINKILRKIKELKIIMMDNIKTKSKIFWFKTELYKKLFADLKNKYNLDYNKGSCYLYTKNNIIRNYWYKELPSNLIFNTLSTNNNKFMFIYISFDVDIFYDNRYDIFKIIFNQINAIENGNDCVIFSYYYPTNDLNFGFLAILLDTFEEVNMVYPTCANIIGNKIYFVCKNKKNNILIPKYEKYIINIKKSKNNINEIRNKMNIFFIDILKYIQYDYKLLVNLDIIKINDPTMYKLIEYKIFSKFIN